MNNIINYQGATAPAFDHPLVKEQLDYVRELVNSEKSERLSGGADYVVKVPFTLPNGTAMATVKVFKSQGRLKDWYDRRHGSKAERSFRAACYLQEKGIGTPAPIAWRDRWKKGRLVESYFLCLFEPGISFRDALSDIYYNQRDNAPLMDLLHLVAPAIRAMHDAGFMHGDMGNQNILLPRNTQGEWLSPQFIDLNRCKISDGPITNEARAFDLARIALPGAYLKIFKTIYNNHEDFPEDLEKLEQKHRSRFWRHRRSSKWRHPIRYWKNKNKRPLQPVYPPLQDIWLWDEKSAQPMIVPGRKEKHLYRDWIYMFSMVWQGLIALPGIYSGYKKLLLESYSKPVLLKNRIGVSLHPHSEYIDKELDLLAQLGNPPVLIRFCHHETIADWDRGISLVNHLYAQHIEVMIAILQDRRALLQPASWEQFLTRIISAIGDKVIHIEITHANNRLKWGIWSSREYAQLMQPALALKHRYPHIKLTGPACIDFEYLPVIAALGALPRNTVLDALSHLLYVDRRGAPENKQGKFSTLEKCALLKALAQHSSHCRDQVIISEVNWPVKHTGIWSPIGCPYETPRWRREQPGENESDYANYMLRYLAITLCSGHIEQVFWWRLSAHGYGLVDDRNGFQPRLAFHALAHFLTLLGDAEFLKRQETPDGLVALEFRKGQQNIMMLWSFRDGEFPLPDFTYQEAYDRDGNPIVNLKISGAPIYLIRHYKQ